MPQLNLPLATRLVAFLAACLRWAAALFGLFGVIGVLFTSALLSRPEFDLQEDFGAGLLTGLLFVLATKIGGGARKLQSSVDDDVIMCRSEDAERIVASLKITHIADAFFLYLRPFFADTLLIDNPRKSRNAFLPNFYYPRHVPWEIALADAVRGSANLIALGMPTEFDGSAKLRVPDKEWLPTFVLLATYAEIIFVWPSGNSTKWEIEWLVSNRHIHKCIFCIPEGYDEKVISPNDNWLTIHEFLLAKGFDVPPNHGVLFTVDPPRHVSLRIGRRRRLRSAIRTLVTSIRNTAPRSGDRWQLYETAAKDVPQSIPVAAEGDTSMMLKCAGCGLFMPVDVTVCPVCDRLS